MTTAPMPIKALAPWFGGKRTLAPRIVELLGPHTCYFEPFAGGCSILMQKPPAPHETINDLHRDLVNLARVVRDPVAGAELYRRVRLIPYAEAEFDASKATINHHRLRALPDPTEPPDVDRAEHYLRWVWLGRNGAAGLEPRNKGGMCIRWAGNGGSPAVRWWGVLRSIAAWRRRLSRVVITCRDGFDMLADIRDETGTAIYCDPPYLVKSDAYAHDFYAKPEGADLLRDDHDRLAEALGRFRRARVVVSYYEHPRLATLYPGWTKHAIEMAKAQSHAAGAIKRATEVLLVNDGGGA